MNLSNGKHALIIIRRVFRGVFVCLSGNALAPEAMQPPSQMMSAPVR